MLIRRTFQGLRQLPQLRLSEEQTESEDSDFWEELEEVEAEMPSGQEAFLGTLIPEAEELEERRQAGL